MELMLVLIPLVAGYVLDLLLGDPRRLPHPVVLFGNLIGWIERKWNKGRCRFLKGGVVAVVYPLGVLAAGWGVAWCAQAVGVWYSVLVATVFVFYGLANRSLIQEGGEVIRALREQGLEAGRKRLSWIVGRDTSELTPKEIYTAVLETMAENLSDGVVAPLFYYAIGGFPAMMAYKMVNTLDSMIGYRDERFRQFGCSDGFVYGGGGLPAGVVPLYPPELLHARQSQFGLSGVCHGRHSGLPLRRCACLSRLVGGKALHR